jgi:uncharacterized protein
MLRRASMTSPTFRLLHLCIPLLALPAALVAALPRAQGYVTDLAGVLDSNTRTEIRLLLRDTEQKTSAEIALATVPSLDGTTVEDYANKLFKEWGIGKKGKDNGVLILVAPTERKIRIEVGYGLEPVLPDGLVGEIIRDDFLPEFKNSEYRGGIIKGVRHIAAIVAANHTLSPEERRQLTQAGSNRPPALLVIPLFSLFVALGGFALGLGFRSRSIFPLLWGGIFAGVPTLLSLIPDVNAPIWIVGPIGLAMLAWGFAKGGSPYWLKAVRGTSKGHGHSSGWVMGSTTSSGRGGSGSSGGGFGGGSSGGGGASGSW